MTAQKKLFTCVSKGGEYELVGTSFGAGPRKGEPLVIYRDTATGKLHHREPENFTMRMKVIPEPVNAGLLAVLESIVLNANPALFSAGQLEQAHAAIAAAKGSM